MKDYAIEIFYSDEDGEYVAIAPDLKGCSATGATPEDALREFQIAKKLWLDTQAEAGWEIPEPKYFPKAAVTPQASRG